MVLKSCSDATPNQSHTPAFLNYICLMYHGADLQEGKSLRALGERGAGSNDRRGWPVTLHLFACSLLVRWWWCAPAQNPQGEHRAPQLRHQTTQNNTKAIMSIYEQPTLLDFLPSLCPSKTSCHFSVVPLVPFLCMACLQQQNCCHSDTLTQFGLRAFLCGVGERTDCVCLWQHFVIEGTRSAIHVERGVLKNVKYME